MGVGQGNPKTQVLQTLSAQVERFAIAHLPQFIPVQDESLSMSLSIKYIDRKLTRPEGASHFGQSLA